LVFHSSTITMMHGPIYIRFSALTRSVFQYQLLKRTRTQTTHNLGNTIHQLYKPSFKIIANNHSGLLYFLQNIQRISFCETFLRQTERRRNSDINEKTNYY